MITTEGSIRFFLKENEMEIIYAYKNNGGPCGGKYEYENAIRKRKEKREELEKRIQNSIMVVSQ